VFTTSSTLTEIAFRQSPCLRVGDEVGHIGDNEMNDDNPKLAFDAGSADSELATALNKITWALAGRVTDPGRYVFTFGWLTITANDLAIWQAYPNAAFTLIRTLTSPPAKTDEEPVGEEFRLGTFELRAGANYSGGEQ